MDSHEIKKVSRVLAHRRTPCLFGGGSAHVDAVVNGGAEFDMCIQFVAFGTARFPRLHPYEFERVPLFEHFFGCHVF